MIYKEIQNYYNFKNDILNELSSLFLENKISAEYFVNNSEYTAEIENIVFNDYGVSVTGSYPTFFASTPTLILHLYRGDAIALSGFYGSMPCSLQLQRVNKNIDDLKNFHLDDISKARYLASDDIKNKLSPNVLEALKDKFEKLREKGKIKTLKDFNRFLKLNKNA